MRLFLAHQLFPITTAVRRAARRSETRPAVCVIGRHVRITPAKLLKTLHNVTSTSIIVFLSAGTDSRFSTMGEQPRAERSPVKLFDDSLVILVGNLPVTGAVAKESQLVGRQFRDNTSLEFSAGDDRFLRATVALSFKHFTESLPPQDGQS
jgi:hypothetical protein